MGAIYANRAEAGVALAVKLSRFANRSDVVVLGLPRGGVPVAFEIAKALKAPLDALVVRKLGVPGHEELAFGAIAEGGFKVINKGMLGGLNLSDTAVDEVIAREKVELERRLCLYKPSGHGPTLEGKIVILVDDGLATGATMEAAVKAVDACAPKEIVVAAPVAPGESCGDFGGVNNVTCVCVANPEPFYSIGLFYTDFTETPDDVVTDLLTRSKEPGFSGIATKSQGGNR